ncbi:MAG: hypothetical protein P8J45_09725 [Phycisphaerales bacterium]|jgi:hypothetical protein|nr:hypothetical protein [Phycisphaerales bacterium]
MNEPPQDAILTRYFLENPWPVAIFLIMAAFTLLLVWNNRGEHRWGLISGACCLLAGLVFLLASVVTTSGEHARNLVRGMVQDAETGDVEGILAVIDPDATLHLESLRHPGRPFEQLEGSIRSLGGSNRITDNTITTLRAWTLDSDTAIVRLGCRTTTESSWRPVPTGWLFKVEAMPGGGWVVRRIAFASLAGKPPTSVLR